MDLNQKHCVPCEAGTPPLTDEQENVLKKSVPEWIFIRDLLSSTLRQNSGQGGKTGVHRLRRQFLFVDFKGAMSFVNKVADLAENEGHHPNIKIVYNKVQVDLYTHAIGGLSENDFIMAAKIDQIDLQSP